MATEKHKNIKIYDCLEDLPIYNFDKMLCGNIEFIIFGYEKGQEFEITEEINNIWSKLYNEYCLITKNNAAINIYMLACEINHLEVRFKIVPVLMDQLLKDNTKETKKEYIKELSKWGFPIDQTKEIIKELEKIAKVLNNSKSKLTRKINEYKELTRGKEDSITLIQQKVKLHNILKIDVNLKTTNVLEWLAYWKEVELISKQKK